MKKKLLIASDTFLPRWDGITRFLLETVPKMSLKYDITLAVPDFKGKKVKIKNVDIVRVPIHDINVDDMKLPKFKLGMIKKLVKESDIVFIQALGPIGILAARYADKLKKPLYAYTHIIEWDLYPKVVGRFKSILKPATLFLSRHFYNKCDFIFVPSDDIEKSLIYARINAQKKIIPLGVDSDEFKPPKSKDQAKKKVKLDKHNIIIGFAGRIGWEKDLKTLHKAFTMLQKKYGGILRLLIVGSGVPLKKMFKSMDGVVHVEATHKVADYYRAMDIFVMPSLSETSSLATKEAMSCGLPVVATSVGCIPFYVNDGKNGYLFEPKDTFMLARKLANLIEKKALRKAIGTVARKTVLTKYTWDKTIKEIEAMLG
ncbi:glycosyltransferase family 4 protein [Thermoproteota archaeon]